MKVNSEKGLQSPRRWSEQFELFSSQPFSGYQLLGREELRNLPHPKWAIKGVLPSRGIALLYGPSGSGKSFITFDMALAIAEGASWFSHTVSKFPVTYVALEGQFGFRLRLEAWEKHHQRKVPSSFKMVLQDFKLTNATNLSHLADALPARSVVIIDTLNRASPMSDENLSSDMGQILEAAKKLQEATDGLVLIVHHSGKSASAGPRGHSSLFASCDSIIEVSRSGDLRKWSLAKAKEDQDGQAFPFSLLKVELGTDEEGDDLTSCVVTSASPKAPKSKMPSGANQKVAFDVIMNACTRSDGVESARNFVSSQNILKDIAQRLDAPPDRKLERAKEALGSLIAKGFVACANDLISIPD